MEPEARTARRALWVFRLIFYPAAALIAAVALGLSFDGPDEPEAWHGRTAQGRPVTLSLLDGRPDVLTTSVLVTCPDGDSYVDNITVYPRPSDGAFELNDSWTQPYDHGYEGQGNTVLHARVRDDSLKGRAWGAQRVAGPGGAYRCDSSTVKFDAQR
jgi:hypothetical protein